MTATRIARAVKTAAICLISGIGAAWLAAGVAYAGAAEPIPILVAFFGGLIGFFIMKAVTSP